MSIYTALLSGWLIAAAVMFGLYVRQRHTLDASIVDVAWTANLGVLAIFYGFALEGYAPRQYLLMGIAGFWSLRLTLYLLKDRIIGREEDGRYQTLRKNWGDKAQAFFFWFFQAQGLLDVILSLSFLSVIMNPKPGLGFWDYAGASLFIISIAGESLADYQLSHFRADSQNRGKTCRSGLWRYSRHPNYFFEWLHWCVYPFLAIGSPYFWMSLIAPPLMLYFIFRITGIPATEEQALLSRGDDYRRYQQTTSAFIPWPPKKEPKS